MATPMAIQGPLIIQGSGSDTMNVDDTGSTTGKTGTLTTTTLTGLNMGASGITYTGLSNLNINLGSGDDTFLVKSTSTATTQIYGNGGNDVLNVRANTGPLNLFGGGGSNTFNLGSLAPATGGVLTGLVGPVSINGTGTTPGPDLSFRDGCEPPSMAVMTLATPPPAAG